MIMMMKSRNKRQENPSPPTPKTEEILIMLKDTSKSLEDVANWCLENTDFQKKPE